MAAQLPEDVLHRPPPGATLTGILPRIGAPTQRWCYRDREGPLFYQCRYEVKGDPADGTENHKEYRPWVWSVDKLAFVSRQPPTPRAIYNLDKLQESTESRVCVVEGEKAADALQSAIPRGVVTTWISGAKAVKLADWTVLKGRHVTLWPDNDDPGFEAMGWLAGRLFTLGCDVRVINVPRETYPKGWDVADAIQGGWTGDQLRDFINEHGRQVQAPKAEIIPMPGARAPQLPPEPEPEPAPLAGWRGWGLNLNSKGLPYENTDNVCRVLNQLRLQGGSFGEVWYDSFAHRIKTHTPSGERGWEESDTIELQTYLQSQVYMTKTSKHHVYDAVVLMARKQTRNPVKDWLESLIWDGADRLSNILTVGWGAADNEYTRAVGRCWLVSAVARIMAPGCQVDMMPVFEGGEGIGKSTALRNLFGRDWHAEPQHGFRDKDFYLSLSEKWCIEFAEMATFQSCSPEVANAAVTRINDYFRAPYERSPSNHPRMCVFAGTANSSSWNKFQFGARRYLPITCEAVDSDWLEEVRDQIWAEALHRYEHGESWWDVPYVLACKEREEHREEDAWKERVENLVHGKSFVTVADVLEGFGFEPDKWTKALQNRVAAILTALGWFQTRKWRSEVQIRGWRPPNA